MEFPFISHTVGVCFFFNLAEIFSCHLKIILSTDQHVSENIQLSHIIMFNMCIVKNVACNLEVTEIRDMKLLPQGTDMLKQHFHSNGYFRRLAFLRPFDILFWKSSR